MRLLEDSVLRIDGRIRSRLNQARHAAVEEAARRPSFWRRFSLMPAASAVAAAVLVAFVLWPHSHQGEDSPKVDTRRSRILICWRTVTRSIWCPTSRTEERFTNGRWTKQIRTRRAAPVPERRVCASGDAGGARTLVWICCGGGSARRRILQRTPNCSNFWVVWIRARIHKQLRTMEVGLNTWRRRISARSPKRPSRTTHRGRRTRVMRSRLRPETKKMNKGYSLVLAMLLAAATSAFAQQAPPAEEPSAPASAPMAPAAAASAQGVPWSSLSGEQQKLLGKFSGNWSALPPERQQALTRGSDRWLGMTPEQRGQAQQRFQRWHSLPPDQRRVLRDRWQRFQSLPPNEQGAVRQNFRRYQQLPPERRQMLRQRWLNASPAERQQMIQRARERRIEMRSGGSMRAPPRSAPPRAAPQPRPRR